MLTSGNDIRYH